MCAIRVIRWAQDGIWKSTRVPLQATLSANLALSGPSSNGRWAAACGGNRGTLYRQSGHQAAEVGVLPDIRVYDA